MRLSIFLSASLLLPAFCGAQTVLLKDGSKLEAVKVTEDGARLSVQTKYAEFFVAKAEVENLEALGFAIKKAGRTPKTDGLEFISELTPDLKVKVEYFFKREKTGMQTFSQTGELLSSEGEIADGTYKEFYPDGKLKKEKTVIDGQNNGAFRTFYPDGKLQSDAYFINGKMNGGHKMYSDLGRLLIERNYINGVANGYAREFDDGGALKSQTLYVNGEPAEARVEAPPPPLPARPHERKLALKNPPAPRAEKEAAFFIEGEVFSLGGGDKEWESNYDEVMGILKENLDYALGDYSSYPGLGVTAGFTIGAYKKSPVYIAGSYVKGPSADITVNVSDSYWGTGTYSEELTTSFYRLLVGYKVVVPLQNEQFFTFDLNAGFAGGAIESEWSSSGTFFGSGRGTDTESWTGFTWAVGPGYSWEGESCTFELGVRYTVFPALADSEKFSDVKWRPFSIKASLLF